MSSTVTTARQAGVLYFLFMIVAIVSEFAFPTFVVPRDAAATAGSIAAATAAYRWALLTSMVTLVLFIALVAWLYRLFERVDKTQALFMVLLVTVGVSVAFANLLHKFAPLVILGGADYLSAFTKPQLDALAFGVLRTHSGGTALPTTFWGLWLFPFGYLVIRSGFLPRILGYLLLVAGVAYAVSGVTSIVLPEHRQAVNRVMMPLYFGEVPIIFWLLLRGARETREAEA